MPLRASVSDAGAPALRLAGRTLRLRAALGVDAPPWASRGGSMAVLAVPRFAVELQLCCAGRLTSGKEGGVAVFRRLHSVPVTCAPASPCRAVPLVPPNHRATGSSSSQGTRTVALRQEPKEMGVTSPCSR